LGILGNIANATKDFFKGAGEQPFASAGAGAYLAASGTIAGLNAGKPSVALDAARKALLRPDLGNLVDSVRLTYEAHLAELNIFGKQVGTNAAAQTFGERIYVQGRYRANDAAQLELLAHELVHSRQYRELGSDLWRFGEKYFREYYRAGLSYDDNSMEIEADEFARCFMLRASGAVSYENLWTSQWPGAWDSLVPFRLGTEVFVQAYSGASGAAQIVRVRANGGGIDLVWEEDWTRGWTSFMPFTVGGAPHCLSYKSGNGTMHLYRLNAGGNGYTRLAQAKWGTGWTSLVPFTLGGQPHYLAYKANTGTVAISKIVGGGTGTEQLWGGKWDAGWTGFHPLVSSGTPHILAYKLLTGEAAIDKVEPNGQGVTTVWEGDWSSGWTLFLPLSNDGKTFLTFKGVAPLNINGQTIQVPGDGHAHIGKIVTPSRGAPTQWCDQWRGSWRCAAAFPLNGVYHTLFAGADQNDVSISRFVV
jgi:hypothetical protein